MFFYFDFKKQILSICLFTALTLFAVTGCRANDSLPRRTWNVNGTTREALVYIPESATSKSTPIIFAFHGHGGTAERVARAWDYQKWWPLFCGKRGQKCSPPSRCQRRLVARRSV